MSSSERRGEGRKKVCIRRTHIGRSKRPRSHSSRRYAEKVECVANASTISLISTTCVIVCWRARLGWPHASQRIRRTLGLTPSLLVSISSAMSSA